MSLRYRRKTIETTAHFRFTTYRMTLQKMLWMPPVTALKLPQILTEFAICQYGSKKFNPECQLGKPVMKISYIFEKFS